MFLGECLLVRLVEVSVLAMAVGNDVGRGSRGMTLVHSA